MKLEAIKCCAGRPAKNAESSLKENGDQAGHHFDGKKSIEIIAEESGDSKSQIQRYRSIGFIMQQTKRTLDWAHWPQ